MGERKVKVFDPSNPIQNPKKKVLEKIK